MSQKRAHYKPTIQDKEGEISEYKIQKNKFIIMCFRRNLRGRLCRCWQELQILYLSSPFYAVDSWSISFLWTQCRKGSERSRVKANVNFQQDMCFGRYEYISHACTNALFMGIERDKKSATLFAKVFITTLNFTFSMLLSRAQIFRVKNHLTKKGGLYLPQEK